MTSHRAALLLCLCFLPIYLASMEIFIEGQVVDESGSPVEGALVRLQGLGIETTSDSDGMWQLFAGCEEAYFPNKFNYSFKQTVNWSNGAVHMNLEKAQHVYTTVMTRDGRVIVRKRHRAGPGQVALKPVDGNKLPGGDFLVSVVNEMDYRGVALISAGGVVKKDFSPSAGVRLNVKEVNDAIMIEHSNYRSSYKAVDSYQGSMGTMTLKKMPGRIIRIDANKGQKLSSLRGKVRAGDVVLLGDGDYGDIANDLGSFSNWVCVKAAPGCKPTATSLRLRGRINGERYAIGEEELYLRFEGITFTNGVEIFGYRKIHLVDCVVRLTGDLIGSLRAIGRTALNIRGSADIRIEGCEVTHTAVGLWVYAVRDILIRNNHIHNVSHDAVQIHEGVGMIFEGNEIHGTDDNSTDRDKKPWNMHSDCLHVYPIYNYDDPGVRITDVILRGNKLYHAEALGVMMQYKTRGQLQRFAWENNIFGPSAGIMFHWWDNGANDCLFRYNTVVVSVNPIIYEGLYRTLAVDNYAIKFPDEPGSNTRVYNNILRNNLYMRRGEGVHVYENLYVLPQKIPDSSEPGFKVSAKNIFANPTGVDGELLANAPAINAGRATRQMLRDINGKLRDARPDWGAVEMGKGGKPKVLAPKIEEGRSESKERTKSRQVTVSVDEVILAKWEKMLFIALRDALQSGIRPYMTFMGQSYRVVDCSSSGSLKMRSGSQELSFSFRRLKNKDRASLAQGLSENGGMNEHQLAAFYTSLIGQKSVSHKYLSKLTKDKKLVIEKDLHK